MASELKKISDLIEAKDQDSATEKIYNKIIDTLHNSLVDNSAEIEFLIIDFFTTTKTNMSHLDQCLMILREIDREQSIQKILDLHFKHETLSNLKDGIKHMRTFGRAPHATIIEKEKELENLENQKIINTLDSDEALRKILSGMSEGQMFTRADLKILAIIPEDKIYNFLISNIITDETKALIKQCISPSYTGAETAEQSKLVQSKFYSIISSLTRNCKLNEKRLKWWGIA